MKVELDKHDIELILTEHVQKLFGGKWRCNFFINYSSSQVATFEKIDTDEICKSPLEPPYPYQSV